MISNGFTWGSWTQKAKLVVSVWQFVLTTLIRETKESSSIIDYTALVIQKDFLLIQLPFRHLYRQRDRIEGLYRVQERWSPWQIDKILSWVRWKQHSLIVYCLVGGSLILYSKEGVYSTIRRLALHLIRPFIVTGKHIRLSNLHGGNTSDEGKYLWGDL